MAVGMRGLLALAPPGVVVLIASACVGMPDPEGFIQPDGAPVNPAADAAPWTPDAAPNAPDSAPWTPDAAPNAPDAAPGTPDAAPSAPDAAPPPPDAAPPPQDEPGSNVDWLAYPEQQSISDGSWGTVLTDIARHLPSEYGNIYWDSDKVTHGHETSHGIHAHLRNNFNNTGQQANAFYALGNKAAIVVEPDIWKHDVAQYVPSSLRGPRFDLYITGSSAWDDTPLYVWDEWVAYTNGGEVGVNLVNSGMWSYGWRDAVMGQLEFTVYALALGMAVRDLDPTYFENNTQFKEFMAYNMKRAMDIFRQGRAMSDFAWSTQDDYYDALRENADAADLVMFARQTFGWTWANQVLGID